MAERAAYLVDEVLPRAPVRQWDLTLPYRLRYQLAAVPPLLGSGRQPASAARRAYFVAIVSARQVAPDGREVAATAGASDAGCGAGTQVVP